MHKISGSWDAGPRQTEALHDLVLRRPAANPHLVDDLLLRSQRRTRDARAIRSCQPSLKNCLVQLWLFYLVFEDSF